jgi:two-component system LytT family response regulator
MRPACVARRPGHRRSRVAKASASADPNAHKNEDANSAEDATSAPPTPLREDDQVFVRDGEHCWFVPVRELRLLESEGNHTRLHFRDQHALLYRTLGSMEARLPPGLFFRANRARLVNRMFIDKVKPWFSGTLKAALRGGGEIEFSRRQAQVFRERLGL